MAKHMAYRFNQSEQDTLLKTIHHTLDARSTCCLGNKRRENENGNAQWCPECVLYRESLYVSLNFSFLHEGTGTFFHFLCIYEVIALSSLI
ncbi:hypothetical protein Gasu2_17640 [Galdieria sulphuraria]|uniref:Uncharacterized protein n=1 Tax=Galdieria sulphuraria TaxID=130081 RepID=M2VTS4_GALSU|nr:uncharacterized protein Gasu_58290 [Galdieria sulphuraria]EME26596.1 hypothetical protein Gasu_58290 [Galdieria sulphuraria]GJD07402.1 hypothetical protein Gasu2_17640 [Galdieria sulphuraria]|eukprot:XP_005703116.1 hypothetical protein Gasu_58290 [Galdieria sulphuraria]